MGATVGQRGAFLPLLGSTLIASPNFYIHGHAQKEEQEGEYVLYLERRLINEGGIPKRNDIRDELYE